jgi:D-inositol-3-phosphate glycosyltransferase
VIERVAYLSMHTSPLLLPGRGDAGGMNVYIDELAATMVGRGVEVDVFTRRADPSVLSVVETPAGYRVIHIDAGPAKPIPAAAQSGLVGDFASGVVSWAGAAGVSYDLVHSHYWLSGWAGILAKRGLGIPLANSFHTLGRVKDAARRIDQPPESLLRIAAEHEVIALSDCVIASTPFEAEDLMLHYGADPGRLCTSPPGIDHDRFRPGDRAIARTGLGLPDQPTVLFVGRIQPLKGLDVAIDAFALVRRGVPSARFVIVGGPSGDEGPGELERLRRRVGAHGLDDAVDWWEPLPHHDLPTVYQAADVLLFPSRSETFGLVAAEAQACGIPVVASGAGGLAYAVEDAESGYLVDGWNPEQYAEHVVEVLTDHELASRLSKGALEVSERFSWEATAQRFLELYAGITS